jgi:hypothetical protein
VAVAVGNDNIGPMPQMIPPGLAGVMNSCSWMSPMPLDRVPSGPGKLLIGTIVRAMTFQFAVSLNGITGWKFRLSSVRSSRSPPVLKLNWSGTAVRLLTGFWVCLARSLTSCAGSGGDACANAGVAVNFTHATRTRSMLTIQFSFRFTGPSSTEFTAFSPSSKTSRHVVVRGSRLSGDRWNLAEKARQDRRSLSREHEAYRCQSAGKSPGPPSD